MTSNILRPSQSVAIVLTVALIVGALGGGIPTIATAQTGQSSDVVGTPDITFSTGSGAVSAGDSGEMTILVVNRGQIIKFGPSQYEDTVTTARGLTFEVQDEDVPIDIQTTQVAAGNFPMQSAQETVSFTVPEDAEPGTYQVPISYEYSYTRHIRYNENGRIGGTEYTRTETGSITVQIKEDARFEIVETNATTQVGDDSDISFTLRNAGSDVASGASVNAESKSSSLTFESGDTSSTTAVGDWNPGEVRTVTYRAALESGAALRGYSLDLMVNYDDTDGISRTSDSITTTVQSIPEQSFALSDVSSSLRAGEDGEITGTIKNTGPKPVQSVAIRPVNNPETVIPGEDSSAVGSLDPGEATSFRLPMEITSGAEVGEKLFDVTVQYRDGDSDRRTYEKLDISAPIEPERDEFELAVDNRTITVGGSRTISVAVTNNLGETVTDVEARLFADDPLSTAGADSSYIESLESGESTTLTFEVAAASGATAGSTYPISFDFRYTDRDGNSHLSDTLRKPLDAAPQSGGGGPPIALILVFGVAVIGGVGVVYWRRR